MSLVFSVEIYLNQISFKNVGVVQPSISVSIDKNNPQILWTSENKVNDAQSITIGRAYQIMVTTDVFDAINSWKFGINLTMNKDQVPLGTCTFEFKPLIASALATCHSSPTISSQGAIRDFQKEIVAVISFNARVVYYPGSEHKQTVEIFLSRPLKREPPHDTYYKPQLQNSSNAFQRSQSNSSISHNNASNSSISVSMSASEADSDLLGSHSSYRNASEATRFQREQISKENFLSQIASAKKESNKTQQSTLHRSSIVNDEDNDDDNNNNVSYTKTTNTTTVYNSISQTSTNNATTNNDNSSSHSSTNNKASNSTSHTSTNNTSSNLSSSRRKASETPHVQISAHSGLTSTLDKTSKVISTENHSTFIDEDFFDDYGEE